MSQFDSYLNHARTELLIQGYCKEFPLIYIPLDLLQLLFLYFNELVYCKLYEKDLATMVDNELQYWWMYREPNLSVSHNYVIAQVMQNIYIISHILKQSCACEQYHAD